jgi:hypothetical protein
MLYLSYAMPLILHFPLSSGILLHLQVQFKMNTKKGGVLDEKERGNEFTRTKRSTCSSYV